MAPTSMSDDCAATNASRPKRASTPASSALASGSGNAVHHALEPTGGADEHDQERRDDERAGRLGHREAAGEPGRREHCGARCAPRDHHRLAQPERGQERCQPHAPAERPQPRRGLRRRRAERLRRLEDDRHRAREADEHGDEAGRHRRRRDVREARAHQARVGRAPSRPEHGRAPSGGSDRRERGGSGRAPGRPKPGRAPSGGSDRRKRGGSAQISTLEPNSTTRLVGRRRKSAAAEALRCMPANSFSRQSAMPPPIVGMTMSRDRK